MPTRAMYTIGVFFLGIFLLAFFWFIFYVPITQISSAVTTMMEPYSGNTTYTAFEYAATFMDNFWKYLLGVAILGLILWAIIYSQRKGEVYG
jgi:hypothetical protein